MKVFKVNETQIKVLRHIFKKGTLCCIVEVLSKDGVKENIEATLFRPGGTIGLLRKPDVDHLFVELLWEVVVIFLGKFMSMSLSFTLCSFETKNRVALKRHFSIVHEQKATKNTISVSNCS